MQKMLLAVILLGLAACAPRYVVDVTKSGPYPAEYRAIVVAHVRHAYFDPYTVRDASISLPEHGRMGPVQGWVVCVTSNAKNRMGGYVGLHTTSYLINSGAVVDSDDASDDVCSHFKFTPFPEIENLQAKGG